jgi:hypothetical protein
MAFGPTGNAVLGLGVAGGSGATIARIDSLGGARRADDGSIMPRSTDLQPARLGVVRRGVSVFLVPNP